MATPDLVRTRDRLAGAGAARGAHAPFEAVEEAVDALGRDPGLVLIFPTGVLDPQEAATQAQAAAGSARVAGMTGSGAITHRRCDRERLLGARVRLIGPGRGGCGYVLRSAQRRALCRRRGSVRASTSTTATPCSSCSSTRSRAIRLRSSPGPTRSRVGASRSLEEPPAVTPEPSSPTERPCPGAWSPSPSSARRRSVSAFRTAACRAERRRSSPARAGGVVLQLDGRPAETVYLEKLGMGDVPLSDSRFRGDRDGASACPAGATRRCPSPLRARPRAGRRPGLRDEHRGERAGRCLRAKAGGDRSQRNRGGRRSAGAAIGPGRGCVCVFDCAARSARFGNPLASREVDSIISSFGDPPPALAGAYTRGEIGRIRGAKGDRNYQPRRRCIRLNALTVATSCFGASSRRRGGRRSSRSSTSPVRRPSWASSSPQSSARRSRPRSRSSLQHVTAEPPARS